MIITFNKTASSQVIVLGKQLSLLFLAICSIRTLFTCSFLKSHSKFAKEQKLDLPQLVTQVNGTIQMSQV